MVGVGFGGGGCVEGSGGKFAVGIWVFLLIFTLHTVLWWRGWFGSCGLMRILACVRPITAIVCLQGMECIVAGMLRISGVFCRLWPLD